jgi:hypothetical protein
MGIAVTIKASAQTRTLLTAELTTGEPMKPSLSTFLRKQS